MVSLSLTHYSRNQYLHMHMLHLYKMKGQATEVEKENFVYAYAISNAGSILTIGSTIYQKYSCPKYAGYFDVVSHSRVKETSMNLVKTKNALALAGEIRSNGLGQVNLSTWKCYALTMFIDKTITSCHHPFVVTLMSPADALVTATINTSFRFYGLSFEAPSTAANKLTDIEKSVMAMTAADAADELVQLLGINEPLWIRSPTSGNYSLHREIYENFFPQESYFRSTAVRFESSRDECFVTLPGRQLVEIFVDSIKWINMFPTIVRQASSTLVLGRGVLGNDEGPLQLLDVQLHNLSPLIEVRQFYLLRYCKQIEPGKWVVADVSYECSRKSLCATRCWKLPSGCMIEDMPGGCSKVTWVEHVEVDSSIQASELYRDLINSGAVFGAERWTVSLQRMCERFTYSMRESMSFDEHGRVYISLEGKRGMKNLAHRMVKNFCAMLNMPGRRDFPSSNAVSGNGAQVSVYENMESGLPSGLIVTAATSLWLPLSANDVFNFFTDERTRTQWDALCNFTPLRQITGIPNGAHPRNSIQVFEPKMRDENQMLILQETCIDQFGGLIVYAPVHSSAVSSALSGENTSSISILPSGLIISKDGHSPTSSCSASSSLYPNRSSNGSLLTLAFQIHMSNNKVSEEADTECLSSAAAVLSSTAQRIKAALGCSLNSDSSKSNKRSTL